MSTARARSMLRTGLVLLTLIQAVVGLWALLLPRSFYDTVLGVALLPPFNEHLLTDVGGLYLGMAAVFAFTAVTLDRLLVWAALVGYLCYSVPHLVFHTTHLAGFDAATAAVQNAGLLLVALLAVGLLVLTRVRPEPTGQ